MEVTNIQEQQKTEHLVWTLAIWAVVWVALYLGFGLYGGIFTSSPQHIPAGMTWVNAGDSATSTFYILRGGPHLILELNPQSQDFWAIALTGLVVLFLYLLSRGLQGKLKDRRGEVLDVSSQRLVALLMGPLAILTLWFGIHQLFQRETLDLDPATDSVTLDGHRIGALKDVTDFRSYVAHARRSTNYHIVMESVGEPPLPIGGGNAHEDVQQTAAYLNDYLASVRQAAASTN